MTLAEFSTEFDLLYNNIGSLNSPGLTEYEKSVFLTKAQDDIIKSYFNPIYNKAQEGFDDSPKRQYDFSSLICNTTLYEANAYNKEASSLLEKIDKRSKIFILPENCFLIINEVISDSNGIYSVIPISHEEYQRVLLKPYSLPAKRSAWKLSTDKKICNIGNYYNSAIQDYFYILSTSINNPLIITVKYSHNNNISSNFAVSDKAIQFPYKGVSLECPVKITTELATSTIKGYDYNISITVESDNILLSNKEVLNIIKHGFNLLSIESDQEGIKWINKDLTISIVALYLEGFVHTKTSDSSFSFYRGISVYTKSIPIPAIEVIGKFKNPIEYRLRYIKTPSPIILEDISSEGVTIRGEDSKTDCQLPSEIHPEILQRAVELAKATYSGEMTDIISIGNNSATEKGMIQYNK